MSLPSTASLAESTAFTLIPRLFELCFAKTSLLFGVRLHTFTRSRSGKSLRWEESMYVATAPEPIRPIEPESFLARYLEQTAPAAPVLAAPRYYPVIMQTGRPVLMSFRLTRTETLGSLCFIGLSQKPHPRVEQTVGIPSMTPDL